MIITKKNLRKKFMFEVKFYLEEVKKDPLFHIFSVHNKLVDFYVAGYNSDYYFKIVFSDDSLNLESYKSYLSKKFSKDSFLNRKFYLIYPFNGDKCKFVQIL